MILARPDARYATPEQVWATIGAVGGSQHPQTELFDSSGPERCFGLFLPDVAKSEH